MFPRALTAFSQGNFLGHQFAFASIILNASSMRIDGSLDSFAAS